MLQKQEYAFIDSDPEEQAVPSTKNDLLVDQQSQVSKLSWSWYITRPIQCKISIYIIGHFQYWRRNLSDLGSWNLHLFAHLSQSTTWNDIRQFPRCNEHPVRFTASKWTLWTTRMVKVCRLLTNKTLWSLFHIMFSSSRDHRRRCNFISLLFLSRL